MKVLVGCFVFLYLLSESCGSFCSYKTYSSRRRKYGLQTYSCASNEYCCGNRDCCVYVYSRWYLWLSIVLVVFLAWLLYRYCYRTQHRNVTTLNNDAAQTTQRGPAGVTHIPMNVVRVNAPQPVQPWMTTTTGTSTQYSAFPPPTQPPPPYSSMMKY
ncbi:WW domain binding protein 1-like [Acropora millepora]|uniref:WW domain binding protein 1-like n=1 Tax=Acropora millepora TaxID=45264 RepID=UPI001CF0DBCD|nr:WW domain binding protein 1-like [Acropora millepora]